MDDFDKATLAADAEARRTGKKAKLPKWEDYGPTPEQMRGAEVIDTSTPEGKKRVAALKKSINKKKKRKRKASRRGHPGQRRLPGMGR